MPVDKFVWVATEQIHPVAYISPAAVLLVHLKAVAWHTIWGGQGAITLN
jgi:hypothetical protein